PWFSVLACYKLGCLLEGTYARAKAGQAPMDLGERHHNVATYLYAKARQTIKTGRIRPVVPACGTRSPVCLSGPDRRRTALQADRTCGGGGMTWFRKLTPPTPATPLTAPRTAGSVWF